MLKKLWDRSSAERVLKQANEITEAFKELAQEDKKRFLTRLSALDDEISESFNINDRGDLKLLVNQERQFAGLSGGDFLKALAHGFFATYCEALLLREYTAGEESVKALEEIMSQMPLICGMNPFRQPSAEIERPLDGYGTPPKLSKESLHSIIENIHAEQCESLMPSLEFLMNGSAKLEATRGGSVNSVIAGFYGATEAWNEWLDAQPQESYHDRVRNYLKALSLTSRQIYELEDLNECLSLCLVYLYLSACFDEEELDNVGTAAYNDSDQVLEQLEIILDRYRSMPVGL